VTRFAECHLGFRGLCTNLDLATTNNHQKGIILASTLVGALLATSSGGSSMENVQQTSRILRKVAIMTLIGFLAVILSGPIIAAAAALLPFAIVGALIYVFIKALILGPYLVGKIIGETFRGILFVLIGIPARILGKAGKTFGLVFTAAWSVLAFALSIAFPALMGGIVGAILGMIGGIEHSDADMRVPAGLLIGAAIGAVAGFLLREKSQSRHPVFGHAHSPQTVLPA
jgi:hypothetical protein